jgi:isopentenyl-diphosphate delta-isomerase
LTDIEKRKERHLRLSLDKDVQSDISTGFEDIHLVHLALPEINLEEVSTKTVLLGKELSSPLIVSAITGGTEYAKEINSTLASVAEQHGIGIGVGSQRIALENSKLEHTFTIVREKAPTTLVMGNIGCPQLSLGWGVDEARKCVEMIKADVLSIHMNPLQEVVQIGGNTNFRDVLEKINNISAELDVPLLMKETGSGISKEIAIDLESSGVSALEVSGVGGTSWAAVEHHIARAEGKKNQELLGGSLWNWGIPTAISVFETKESTNLEIIASGGLRTGLEMAKAIALGANAVGIAKPFLEKAVEGQKVLSDYIEEILMELRAVMFLVGAKNIEELKTVPVVILGRTAEWLRVRGFDIESLANRV